jgi:tetratricopeptide (TPR) repeat protein
MTTSPLQDPEPTPEFELTCQQLINAWSSGALPIVQALTRLEAMGEQARQENRMAHQGRVEHLLGYIYQDLGDVNTSIQHYDKAQRFYLRLNNAKRLAGVDLNQGENYRDKGDYARALELYQRAYRVADECGEMSIKTFARGNQGWVYLAMKDDLNAQKAFEEAIDLCEHYSVENIESSIAEFSCGLATVALTQGRYENAWTLGYEGFVMAQLGREMREIGMTWRVLGDALTMLPAPIDPSMPIVPDSYYKHAIEAFQMINAEAEVARTLLCQAKSLVHRGARAKASTYFREAIVIFTRLGLMNDALQATEAQLKGK